MFVSAHEGARCGKRHYAIASYPGIEDAAFENIRYNEEDSFFTSTNPVDGVFVFMS